MTCYQYDDAMQVLNTTIEKALFEVQVDPDLTPSMKEDLANVYRDLFHDMQRAIGSPEDWDNWVRWKQRNLYLIHSN